MTSIDDLKAHVGNELFDEARRWAWETAAGTGRSQSEAESGWSKEVVDVPHDLCDLIWFDEELGPLDRVVLHFALYREMPCYANLMYASPDELDAAALDLFWQHIQELLNDADDRLADPVSYWLWCGEFEDHNAAPEAWRRTIQGNGAGERGLARALDVSGPVPWQVKAPLLRKLLPDQRWHGAIFRSIQSSAFDVFGSVDIGEATALLRELKLSGDDAAAAAGVTAELASRPVKRRVAQRKKFRRAGRKPRH